MGARAYSLPCKVHEKQSTPGLSTALGAPRIVLLPELVGTKRGSLLQPQGCACPPRAPCPAKETEKGPSTRLSPEEQRAPCPQQPGQSTETASQACSILLLFLSLCFLCVCVFFFSPCFVVVSFCVFVLFLRTSVQEQSSDLEKSHSSAWLLLCQRWERRK